MITLTQARKVQEVVDAGLSAGVGTPDPGYMCVEAAVCYALGEPHSDRPSCVGTAVRMFKIVMNDDGMWDSRYQRAAGLRRIAVAQLGSNRFSDEQFIRALRARLPAYVPKVSYWDGGDIALAGLRANRRDETIEAAVQALRDLGCEGVRLLDEIEAG